MNPWLTMHDRAERFFSFENEFWTTQRSGNNLCRHASEMLNLEGLQTHATVDRHANFEIKTSLFSSDMSIGVTSYKMIEFLKLLMEHTNGISKEKENLYFIEKIDEYF